MSGVKTHTRRRRRCTTHMAARAAPLLVSLYREGIYITRHGQTAASHPDAKGYVTRRGTVTKRWHLTCSDDNELVITDVKTVVTHPKTNSYAKVLQAIEGWTCPEKKGRKHLLTAHRLTLLQTKQ